MVDQPQPSPPSDVEVWRAYAVDGSYSEKWDSLSYDVSLNQSDSVTLSGPTPAPTPGPAGLVSTITDDRIDEISGWVHSALSSDLLYLTNDRGENPQIFAVQPSTGNVVGTFGINYVMTDPEAIAMDPTGRLWIADIGDNDNNRSDKSFAVIGEPGPGDHGILTPVRYPVSYPGNAKYDAECFLISPTTGEAFIVTKNSGGGMLFQLPGSPSTSGNTCVNLNRTMPSNVTDGCITSDGKYAVFRSSDVSTLIVYSTESWEQVTTIPAPAQYRGEAITMEPDGLSVLLGSEASTPGGDAPIDRVVLFDWMWPDAPPPVTNYALWIRAKVSAEFYEDGVASQCRRIVVWYQPEGGEWVRHTESSWSIEGRWWCSAEESDYQYFNISMPTGTRYQLWIDTENYQIINNARATSDPVEGSVWSNRVPTAEQTTASGITVDDTDTLDLHWKIVDEDSDSLQTQYDVQVRRAAYGPTPPSGVVLDSFIVDDYMLPTETGTYTVDASTLPSNLWYEWRVAVKDFSLWSPWSPWRSFYIVGSAQTPLPLSPAGDTSIDVGQVTRFTWDFRDDEDPTVQELANLRFRTVGSDTWTTLSGTSLVPGANEYLDVGPGTFLPGLHYEWQVQTQASSISALSDWSTSATFWSVPSPANAIVGTPNFNTSPQGVLGCGTYRAFIYDRGGRTRRGEVTPIKQIQWDRRRDDISQATIHTNGFGEDCAALLKQVHCWMHELVLYRDGVRVWEGPIVRIGETDDGVELDARDPMAYVYRRILRTGYNDSYPNIRSTVFRATRIIQDALAYDDPNVLGYLTPINNIDDAKESRVVAAWSKSAWEEVDDLAANAGLDYTTVGRRIILWDVHREIGRLPEMKNGDFSDPVIVTEYGMLTANVFAVTNNAGVYGYTQSFFTDPGPYGYIEQIASSYGESDAAATEALTPEQLASLQATLKGQAERNISGRYPNPIVVRVPDNTTLSADLEIGINQLVPGVRIPLRSVGALREVTQLQRLDKVTGTFDSQEQEKLKVVLSPAPTARDESEPEPLPI